mmetsp:Transcript_13401/g.37066  ORF Transcript_13401/g.37066 Transcript_13401/m.37066 type:complete len:179 (-) Transcript_13401:169-705(-)
MQNNMINRSMRADPLYTFVRSQSDPKPTRSENSSASPAVRASSCELTNVARNREIAGCIRKQTIVLEGYMEKRGFWNPSWKSRYCALDDVGRFSYFQSKEQATDLSKALGSIPIDQRTVISPVVMRGKRATIQIRVSSGRVFHMSCNSTEEAEAWVQALENMHQCVHYVAFPQNVRHW